MHQPMRLFDLLLMAVIVLSLAAVAPVRQADAQDDENEIPFSRTKIIIEFNPRVTMWAVQVLLDGEPWKRVAIFSPNGGKLFDIEVKGACGIQGLTELFFESSEPSLDEVPLAEFLARFPEGKYEFEGMTVDG